MANLDYVKVIHRGKRTGRDWIATHNTGNSCMWGASRVQLGGTVKENRDYHTMICIFDDDIDWKDWDHPLIQALVPGLKVEGGTVTCPLRGVPFDQVITALRLLRRFSNYKEWRGAISRYPTSYICNDGWCGVLAVSHKAIIELAKSKNKLRGDGTPLFNNWTTHDVWCYGAAAAPIEKAYGATAKELTEQAFSRLDKGLINPGVLPEFSECLGYTKGYAVVPPTYAIPNYQDEILRPYYEEHLKKHGDVFYSVDHCLCVFDAAYLGDK